MSDLKYFQDKIIEKRKQTNFRDYLKEITSWMPIVLHKDENNNISRYPKTNRIKNLVGPDEYYNENDDFINRGLDYNFNINFFENFKNLKDSLPNLNKLVTPTNENADFCESVVFSKNVYLSYIIINSCENILYTFYTQDSVKNALNSVMVWDHSEIVYFSSAILKSYKIYYSKFIVNSNNIWFSSNLLGCSECIFCDNLENKKYCINNREYKKNDYFAKKEKILKDKNTFLNNYKKVNKVGQNLGSKNTKGSFNVYSSDIENGYFNYRLTNARNAIFVGDKDGRANVYDTFASDDAGKGDIFACLNLGGSENVYCSDAISGQSLYYCFICIDCSYCIGCTGLFNKSYCILNKQYTKDKWKKLACKIFDQMEKDGILGDFFPGELNPFYFNDTIAGILGDFNKEEVEKDGYLWRDEEIKTDIPKGIEIVNSKDLNNYQGFDTTGNWQINPDILNKVIIDEKGDYYRIVKMEYDFLVKHGLPLPEIHWMDRMKLNFGV